MEIEILTYEKHTYYWLLELCEVVQFSSAREQFALGLLEKEESLYLWRTSA